MAMFQTIPHHLTSGCSSLYSLDLSRNQITNLAGLSRLRHLKICILSHNALRDFTSVAFELGKCKQIERLDLRQNDFNRWSQKSSEDVEKHKVVVLKEHLYRAILIHRMRRCLVELDGISINIADKMTSANTYASLTALCGT